MSGFLAGKRALITGIASPRSIASGIAQAMHEQGAKLALTYAGDKLKSRVEAAAEEYDAELCLPLDVTSDEQIADLVQSLESQWGGVDILIHSIGFAPRELLKGGFLESVTRDGFAVAHDISAYSFAALGKALYPLMPESGGSMLTLTYLGAERALPGYNVMGPAKASLEASVRYMAAELGPRNIRVNGISAGPIKTLAAAGISGFRDMLSATAQAAPLGRNVEPLEVGNTAAFLCSDLASGITGEILFVDAGYHIQGMPNADLG
ncbi:enoyl-ACP reductase [uncultured Abyssibacter sp.]|uniref:enoyl-ACP reductase FabI n=1 Tax=uncultured Abyssibacter sp. TaxID=2320202 RepID=UPI0032B1EF89